MTLSQKNCKDSNNKCHINYLETKTSNEETLNRINRVNLHIKIDERILNIRFTENSKGYELLKIIRIRGITNSNKVLIWNQGRNVYS
jgi:hypothetical protein